MQESNNEMDEVKVNDGEEEVEALQDPKTKELYPGTQLAEEEERIEESQVDKDNLEAAKGTKPLVNGFRNKTVIYPVALLQQRIENFEDLMGKSLQQHQKETERQTQYAFQYFGQIAKRMSELELVAEAMTRLVKINDDTLEEEVENIKAERAADKEKKQDEAAGLRVVNRAAEEGDVVKIDFVGTIDGKEFDGGTVTGHQLELGSGHFIPGFENQLIGTKPGETTKVQIVFAKDYGNKKVAGKYADFQTTVTTVKEYIKTTETEAETKEK